MAAAVDVKVDVGEKREPLSMHAKLAHVLAIVVAATIAFCVAAVQADGTSVIKLKAVANLPIITNLTLRSQGIYYRADELLGPTYGIGLHHDQSGRSWTEIGGRDTVATLVRNLGIPAIAGALPSVIATDGLKHPVPLLSCEALKTAGLTAMALGWIAFAASVVMVAFHSLHIAGMLPPAIVKPFAGLVWFVLTAGFLIVVLLAEGIYTANWKCDNIIIPQLRLTDHFEYNYGFALAIIGYAAALLTFLVILTVTSMNDGAGPASAMDGSAPVKVVGGVVLGSVVGVALSMIILSANHEFDSRPPLDPTFNPCSSQRPFELSAGDRYFHNTACEVSSIVQTLEQAGGNVTRGYVGGYDAGNRVPILTPYSETNLCPVNVHWHLGAEHLSVGQFDEAGHGPGHGHYGIGDDVYPPSTHHYDHNHTGRQLAGADPIRLGLRCHHYDENDARYTTPYNWQHCTEMVVGETYEVHWPHSAAGACGTKWQFQTPFYDGVFCNDGIITVAPLNTYETIGVQSQVFTIVNDDSDDLYYPDLMQGMLTGGNFAADMAIYTGSTTGTTRNNDMCSRYTPITWQVDRTCHVISARTWDKMCEDMSNQAADMHNDYYPHGARTLVQHEYVADNQHNRAHNTRE